jgi:hypothetical protein
MKRQPTILNIFFSFSSVAAYTTLSHNQWITIFATLLFSYHSWGYHKRRLFPAGKWNIYNFYFIFVKICSILPVSYLFLNFHRSFSDFPLSIQVLVLQDSFK